MNIYFLPNAKKIEVNAGENLLSAAEKAGVLIDASCAGAGKCGKCKVKITQGEVNSLTAAERELLSANEINHHYRLACCVTVHSDLEVIIPAFHGGSTRKKNLTQLPEDFVPEPRIVDDPSAPCFGIAFDIGTTTVVGMLWDLHGNQLTDAEARTNYQSIYGADVISRIQFCNKQDSNTDKMQQKIVQCMNDLLEELCGRNGIRPEQIYDATAVGNTTMSHLLSGVHPKSLGQIPFTPVFCAPQSLPADRLGLHINPCADVFLLPNIAGHVGSDIVGMMLAVRMDTLEGCHIAVDIGTNGEVVLTKNGRMLTCSTAAGPAFEGASIHHGMHAAPGAIERVTITRNDVLAKTIEGLPPAGICGSGLFDAVAQVLEAGIVDSSGRMLSHDEALASGIPPQLAERLIEAPPGLAFILAYREGKDDILLTQKDIREVQLAKGAILAGIQTLMKILAVTENDIDSILLAGAFGNYIRKESALRIGLFPRIPVDRILSVGNAAGAGSSMALLSGAEREHACKIAETTEHIELSVNMDFQELYIAAMSF